MVTATSFRPLVPDTATFFVIQVESLFTYTDIVLEPCELRCSIVPGFDSASVPVHFHTNEVDNEVSKGLFTIFWVILVRQLFRIPPIVSNDFTLALEIRPETILGNLIALEVDQAMMTTEYFQDFCIANRSNKVQIPQGQDSQAVVALQEGLEISTKTTHMMQGQIRQVFEMQRSDRAKYGFRVRPFTTKAEM